jgi:hypothetical protein
VVFGIATPWWYGGRLHYLATDPQLLKQSLSIPGIDPLPKPGSLRYVT